MIPRIAADLLVVLHLAFIVFVLAGGLLVLRYRWLLCLHVPAALWGMSIELLGWQCPLTPIEQYLRSLGGPTFQGGFVEHYLLPLVYPPGLPRQVQIFFGLFVVIVNGGIYGWVALTHMRKKEAEP